MLLSENPSKLKRFWEARVIELAEFEAPDVATGQVPDVPKTDEPKTDAPKAPVEPVDPVTLVVKVTDRKWTVTGIEGEVFPSKTKAMAAAAELIAKQDAPSDETLVGSDAFDAEISVGDEVVTLGDVVQLTFEGSGLTVTEWNEMPDVDREAALSLSIQWMTADTEDDDGL